MNQHATEHARIVAEHQEQLKAMSIQFKDEAATLRLQQQRLSDEHLLLMHEKQKDFDAQLALFELESNPLDHSGNPARRRRGVQP